MFFYNRKRGEYMTGETFRQLDRYARHLSHLFSASVRIVDLTERKLTDPVYGDGLYFCEYCKKQDCKKENTYLYGVNEAYRWGGKYIYYCPAGLVFIASAVSDQNGMLAGGLTLGPLVMGDVGDMISEEESEEHARLLHIANLPTDKVNDLSELMAAAAGYVSGTSASLAGEVDVRQEQILQSLYSEKNKYEAASESYPIETEKKLQMMILNGDKKGAQDMLNELLAHIYYVSNFDVDVIKIRVIELLVVLSRATIDAGADTKEILWFSTNCIKQMQECVTVEQISVWITQIMHRFVSYSFDFSAVKHSDTVYKVIDYIKQHYFTRITLEDVARHVNFNKTYLSRIFKEETGDSFTTYVNKVRIEKSKLMLLDKSIPLVDVANLAGFEDQSYFTKVFKNLVGISPKRFRECRGKGRV